MNQDPTITEVWEFLRMPGVPSKSCCSPFRQDSKPSFSVYQKDGKELFKDFAVAQCKGDVWAFVSFAKKAGYDVSPEMIKEIKSKGPLKQEFKELNRDEKKLMWKDLLDKGDLVQHWQLARLRKLKLETIERAVELGLLRFCKWRGKESWVITDSTLNCAQARRLDGTVWDDKNDCKAITLPGSAASWPIGCRTIPDNWDEQFILVEGGPDILAALQSVEGSGTAVCGMLGASQMFTPEVINCFKDTRVNIVPHSDEAGQKAAKIWARQLNGVAEVIITKLPAEYKDFNLFISSSNTPLC